MKVGLFSLASVLVTVCVAEPDPTENELCKKIRHDPIPTEQDYNTTIAPWLQEQLNEWRRYNPVVFGVLNSFLDVYIMNKYAPYQRGPLGCGIGGDCVPIDCKDFDPRHKIDDQFIAYYGMRSLASWNNHRRSWYLEMTNTFIEIEKSERALVEKYSSPLPRNNSEAKGWNTARREREKSVLHPLLGPLMVSRFEKIPRPQLQTWNWPNGTNDLLVTINMTTVTDPNDRLDKMTSAVKSAEVKNFAYAKNWFSTDTMLIENGQAGSANKTIVDYIASGKYTQLNPPAVATEDIKYLWTLWIASRISDVWNLEYTYITMADTMDCATDDRGPKELKACFERLPGYVFYLYYLPHNTDDPNVDGPPGYQFLKEANITVTDIIQSSVAHFYANGNEPNVLTPKSIFRTYWSRVAMNPGPFPGMFTIPVVYTPNGMAISPSNDPAGRRYPCMSATAPWRPHARSLSSRNIRRQSNPALNTEPPVLSNDTSSSNLTYFRHSFLPSISETLSFVNSTGLYASYEFANYCIQHQACENATDEWSNSWPKDQNAQITHPFMLCRAP